MTDIFNKFFVFALLGGLCWFFYFVLSTGSRERKKLETIKTKNHEIIIGACKKRGFTPAMMYEDFIALMDDGINIMLSNYSLDNMIFLTINDIRSIEISSEKKLEGMNNDRIVEGNFVLSVYTTNLQRPIIPIEFSNKQQMLEWQARLSLYCKLGNDAQASHAEEAAAQTLNKIVTDTSNDARMDDGPLQKE